MSLLGPLFLVALSFVWAEEQFYLGSYNDTWDNARNYCQKCYKDLTTITPGTVQLIQNLVIQNLTAQNLTAQNLTAQNLSFAYWIGLRQNFSGSLFWSQWSNGAPVIYQNWYPGRPVLKKMDVPVPTSPAPTNSTAGTTSASGTTTTTGTTASTTTTGTTTPFNEMVQCPTLRKLIDCLNGSHYLVTPNTSNSTFSDFSTTTDPVTTRTSTPRALSTSANTYSSTLFLSSPSTSLFTSTIVSTTAVVKETDFDYIDDSCVALLSFGMWREKHCNELLPFICYDDRFYGTVEISNLTQGNVFLSWSEAPGNIDHYRVEQFTVRTNNTTIITVNGLNTTLQYLIPGTQYNVQVIPVKCSRDLNPQNISFSTLPMEISNVSKVNVETNSVSLNWSIPIGGYDSYSVNWLEGENDTFCTEKGNISQTAQSTVINLQPGQLYSFAVCAVVNKTIFGLPGRIRAYTKPSQIQNLTSENKYNSMISASWNSSDRTASNYKYHVVLKDDTGTEQNNSVSVSSNITITSLQPGTKYSLTVSALVNDSLEGKAITIPAYTTPVKVYNVTLVSSESVINATWPPPEGNFSKFRVQLFLYSLDRPLLADNTTNLNYMFTGLKSTSLYYVSVITYGKLEQYPSEATNASCYTKPVPPANVNAEVVNSTAIKLKWDAPQNSDFAQSIVYNVIYRSNFWADSKTWNETITNASSNTITVGGLRSGTNYSFSVSVYAGTLQSNPTSTFNSTEPRWRNLTLTMMCSSSTKLYCKKSSTKTQFQNKLVDKMQNKFQQDIIWSLNLSEGK